MKIQALQLSLLPQNGLDTGSSGNRYATYTILGNRTFNSGHNVTINRSIINGDVGDPATLAVYNAEFLNAQASGTGTYYGFFSNLNSTRAPGGTVYNFYAQGDALNKFEGITDHAGGVKISGGPADLDDIVQGSLRIPMLPEESLQSSAI